MSARRCSRCSINWPNFTDYDTCPECLERTDTIINGKSIDKDEAEARTNQAKFDRYYRQREEAREARGEPSPDDLGALQARAEIELIESAFA